MRTKIYAICALILAGFAVKAQDIHFSQYYASPLTLNPALTGKFDGFFRISGIYRGQDYGMPGASIFRTPSLSADVSLFKDKMKGNAFGVGLAFVNDVQNSATGKIATNELKLSLSYILNLDKKKTTQISIGLQPTLNWKKNSGTYEFPQAFNSSTLVYDPTNVNNEIVPQVKKMYFNFDAGLFFNTHPAQWITFYMGYQMANIARPDLSIVAPQPPAAGTTTKVVDNKLPFRHMIHGGFEFQLAKKWVLIPGFLYQTMGAANEANAGLTAGYVFQDKNVNGKQEKGTIFLGLWNRMGNDVNTSFQYRNITPKIGLDYKNMRIGFAYDIAIGGMASDAHPVPDIYRPQAYELSFSYIGLGPKTYKDRDLMFSPRF